VYLPGREARVREPLIRSYSELIGAITEVLLPYTREPYAFFGHSMGAFLGYETALRFIDAGLRAPEHLFVSGRQAPHIRCDFISKPVGQMTDGEFVDELAPLNDGSFRALMDNPELSALVMPSLRADFEVCQTYCPSNHVPIEVPITAFCGTSDASVTDKDTDAWRTATSGAFSLRIIPGDHFFVTASGRQIQQFIRTALMNT
jgi:surfactin synthase thioesterase subunit